MKFINFSIIYQKNLFYKSSMGIGDWGLGFGGWGVGGGPPRHQTPHTKPQNNTTK